MGALATTRYAFGEDYQRKLAAYIIRDPYFLLGYGETVDPAFFDSPRLTSVVRLVREFVDKFGLIPTRESLGENIKSYCLKFGIHKEIESLLVEIDNLYRLNITDHESLKEKIVGFSKRQALRSAVLDCGALVQQDDVPAFERARAIIDRALRVGENINQLGITFEQTLPRLPQLLNEDSAYTAIKRIPTGFPTLDERTYGGPGRKQVWTVLGLSGGGKSMWLVNMAVAALKRGMPVIHYTLGDLQEVDVFLRYTARLTGISMDKIIKNSPEYQHRATELAKWPAKLLIKYYPSQIATINTLKSHLTTTRSLLDISPALIIVDYADELAENDTPDMYLAGGRVYAGLSQIANDFDALVWTASQVNRYSPSTTEEDLIKKANIADSFKKVMKVDGIVTINQTEHEYELGKGRIWMDKVRRGKSFKKFPVKIDLSRCLIREVPKEDRHQISPPSVVPVLFVPSALPPIGFNPLNASLPVVKTVPNP